MLRMAVMGLFAVFSLAQQRPENIPEHMKKMGHGEGRLQPGFPAPDFRLKKQNSEELVSLSSFQGKRPVALVFASYT